jgi:hypothetical protein
LGIQKDYGFRLDTHSYFIKGDIANQCLVEPLSAGAGVGRIPSS